MIEVQGRVSGGNAFARFIALNNLRAELAELQVERERLLASVSTFQELLDSIEQPVWRRNGEVNSPGSTTLMPMRWMREMPSRPFRKSANF